MNSMTKPRTQQPPPRTGWHYDNYFLEQLAKIKHKAENNRCKSAMA